MQAFRVRPTALARRARLFSTEASKAASFDISGQALPGRAVYLDAQVSPDRAPRTLAARADAAALLRRRALALAHRQRRRSIRACSTS
jgi:hypothetical protein